MGHITPRVQPLARNKGAAAPRNAKTECPQGHAYAEHGVWMHTAQGLKRRCRECMNARRRVKRAGKRTASTGEP